MANLKCAVEKCTYNKDHLCSKGDIMVAGKNACTPDETRCDSFAERRGNGDSFTSSLEHPSQIISIDCEAVKCAYNTNYKCSADSVSIQGCGACNCRDTSCATFSER